MSLVLPTKPSSPKTKNPRLLMFYSTPKAGKTTVLAGLKDCLIIDLEGGADFVNAMVVDGSSLEKLRDIKLALMAPDAPKYKYIALDPITRLEDIVLPLARAKYVSTPQGSSFALDNVLHLPNGAGYLWLRQAFEEVVFGFRQFPSETLILSGHLREKMLEKEGKEVSFVEIDLTGKLRSIMSGHADAIARLYRETGEDGINRGIMSFKRDSEAVITGARPLHLRDKEIVISELQKDGTVKTFWDSIFLPE
jgi:hypothetical protein